MSQFHNPAAPAASIQGSLPCSAPTDQQGVCFSRAPDLAELVQLSHESHPLCTMLRQGIILNLLLALSQDHAAQLHQAALSHGTPPELLCKGLCVKGSATLPPNLRRANDLDMTVNIGLGYSPNAQRMVLPQLIADCCATFSRRDAPVTVVQADLSDPLLSNTLRRLGDEKALCALFVVQTFSRDEVARLHTRLQSLFDFSEAELAVLSDFQPETVRQIIAARRDLGAARGIVSSSSEREFEGVELRVVVAVEIASKDALNIFAPYRMGMVDGEFESAFTKRSAEAEPTLSFVHPIEECTTKIFALLTNDDRARLAQAHARDLVDLYVRTGSRPFDARAFAPFTWSDSSSEILTHHCRVAWAAHPEFFRMGLSFKYIDPSRGPNIKQVRNGLLGLQGMGTIGPTLFGQTLTRDNVDGFAIELLEHAWNLCKGIFGVQRSGPNKSPRYDLVPPESVARYWRFCRTISRLTEKPLSPERDQWRANRCIAALESLIAKCVDADAPPELITTGALNAYLAADSSRMWSGLHNG